MKPNPFCELKNFTVPEAILISLKERTNASADPHNHLRRPRSGFGVLGEGPLGGRSPGRLNLERQEYRDTRTDLQTSTLLSIEASSLSSVIGVSSRRPSARAPIQFLPRAVGARSWCRAAGGCRALPSSEISR